MFHRRNTAYRSRTDPF